MKTAPSETQADWIMLRLIELHVQRGRQILLIEVVKNTSLLTLKVKLIFLCALTFAICIAVLVT